MSKTADRAAIRALPALRASLRWYKANALRTWRGRLEGATRPLMRKYIGDRMARLRATPLAAFRGEYLADRVRDICTARLWHLERTVTKNEIVRIRVDTNLQP